MDDLNNLLPKKKGRTKFQKEYHYTIEAEMYLKRHTKREIADALGISTIAVSRDLEVVISRWKEKATQTIDFHKMKMVEELEMQKKELYAGWERSKTYSKKTHTKSRSQYLKDDEEDLDEGKGKRVREEVIYEEEGGDLRWMDRIDAVNDKICKILGLYAPKEAKLNIDANFGERNNASREEILGLIHGMKPQLNPSPDEKNKDAIDAEIIAESADYEKSEVISIAGRSQIVEEKLNILKPTQDVPILVEGRTQNIVSGNNTSLKLADEIQKLIKK